jgi:putative ABC transport system substrate-binding protein
VLAVIAVSLVLSTSAARGQEPVHRVGFLGNIETLEGKQAWLEGLRERGYVVGRNLQVEYRYSQARTEQIPALVTELVAFGPEVIVTSGPQLTFAVHAAAPTIPLVFLAVADPVALGLVESLAHPAAM